MMHDKPKHTMTSTEHWLVAILIGVVTIAIVLAVCS